MSVSLGTVHVSVDLQLQKLRQGIKEAKVDLRGFETTLTNLGSAATRVGSKLSLAITAPLVLVGKQTVDAAVKMDSLRRALDTITGSSELTSRRLKELREVAKLPGLNLEQAVQGDVRLRAVGISADRSRKALENMGNALASVGRGASELDGVITALVQIQAKGKVSAEEINQLQERLPQIRKAMLEVFGTADTEKLQKAGITSDKFIDPIMDWFARLPRVTGGAQNALENFNQTLTDLKVAIGNALLPTLTRWMDALVPKIQAATGWFDKLSPSAKDTFAVMGTALAATGPILVGLGILLTSLGNIKKAMDALLANAAFRALFIPAAVATAGAVAFKKLDEGGFFDWLGKNLPSPGKHSLTGASRPMTAAEIESLRASEQRNRMKDFTYDPFTGKVRRKSVFPMPVPDAAQPSGFGIGDIEKQTRRAERERLRLERERDRLQSERDKREAALDFSLGGWKSGKFGGKGTGNVAGRGPQLPEFSNNFLRQFRDIDIPPVFTTELSEKLAEGLPAELAKQIQEALDKAHDAAIPKKSSPQLREVIAKNLIDPDAIAQQLKKAIEISQTQRVAAEFGKDLGSNLAYELGREFSGAFDKVFGTGNPLSRALNRTLTRLLDDLLYNAFSSGFGGKGLEGLFGGKGIATDKGGGVAQGILGMVASVALGGLLGGIFKGGGIGKFFGGLFKAEGGPVRAGFPYVVGERGPELFVPKQSGTVLAGAGGISISIPGLVIREEADLDRLAVRIDRRLRSRPGS